MGGVDVIIGFGVTGESCARYLAAHARPFDVMDRDPSAEKAKALRAISADAALTGLNASRLTSARRILLSPGVPLATPEIQQAITSGVTVTGDVALFCDAATTPVAAITGSNGKSTVTELVGYLGVATGRSVGIGGNIGRPCLDLLAEPHDACVVEVSSYQLEVTDGLPVEVAAVLNLAPDHQDRYPSLDAYYETKARIYHRCRRAVVNRVTDYPFVIADDVPVITFGPDAPQRADEYGIVIEGDDAWLARGDRHLVRASELAIHGAHNYQNALAALAVGEALGWPLKGMIEGLKQFPGLPHRMEVLQDTGDITWINDSKSTNVASSLAALEGVESPAGELILVLGGQGKGDDFSVLADAVRERASRVFIYGQDRRLIEAALTDTVELTVEETLDDVLVAIRRIVDSGDVVLFSPGCASLDQFRNFEARGEAFRQGAQGGAA